jgi:hypothetical protein
MEMLESGVEIEERPGPSLEEAIRLACEVVAIVEPEAIGSAQVVGRRRLTAAELARAHEIAAELGVRLTMNGDGALSLRRIKASGPPIPARHGWRERLARFGHHAGSQAA